MKFQKRQNTGTGKSSVVTRGQRCGRQGGHEETGGVTEVFYIVSMVELMLLCAFVKTDRWPLEMVNRTVHKLYLNKADKNLGRLS